MKHRNKLHVFYEVAESLNQGLQIRPVLYGSLGLSQLIDEDIEVDDIDILIESNVFDAQSKEINEIMLGRGFTLIDIEESEYQRGGIKVGLATDGDMLGFAGIDPALLKCIDRPVTARLLSLEQYYACYMASIKDGYRKNIHNKNDDAKLRLIKKQLGVPK